MPPVKPVDVLRVGSGKRNESEPDCVMEHPAGRLRGKRGNKQDNPVRGRTRQIWKVKLPKLPYHCTPSKVTRDPKTPTTQQQETNANRTKTAVSHRGKTRGASNDGAPADRDIFFFSPTTVMNAQNEKEKAKLLVLRTISKMLEENQLIRKRMAALDLAN